MTGINERKIYKGSNCRSKKNAENGFKDDMIFDFIKSGNSDKKILDIKHIDIEDAIKTFEKFESSNYDVLY